jgi:hypothetical protein
VKNIKLPVNLMAVKRHEELFMKIGGIATPAWSTASFSDTTDTSPMELSALGDHLNLCQVAHRRLFSLHCAAETMHGFVATRFVTTLVVIALLLTGVGLLVS